MATAGSVTTVTVPDTLKLYLARRCADPEVLLVDLLRATMPRQSISIPPGEDAHRGFQRCSLRATTVMKRQAASVKVTIALKECAVVADLTSTDLILNKLPEMVRSGADHGLLKDKFDIPFLPRDLEILKLFDQGAGVMIRCQPVTFDIALAVPHGNQGLSDVCGHVSGSGRRF